MEYQIGDTWIKKPGQTKGLWKKYELIEYLEDKHSYRVKAFHYDGRVSYELLPFLEDDRYTFYPGYKKILKVLEKL